MPPSSDAIPASKSLAARAVQVLVVASDRERALRWMPALQGDRFDLYDQPALFTAASPPEVIVTDKSLACDDFAEFHEQMIRGDVGVVLIGRNLPADVVLPDDCTRRELRLACKLLANVVSVRRQIRRLTKLAATDPLTGLANRRALEEEFARLMAAAPRTPGVVALAMFDLDQFKNINAEFGHLRGDEVLRRAAATLQSRAKQHLVARLGGDEFVLLSQFACTSDASQLVDDIRRATGLSASLVLERPLSCSAGVATTDAPDSLASLLNAADEALRRAKAAGGKRTEVQH
jgi:diguanylate cyclase (GGDEF)-like protein